MIEVYSLGRRPGDIPCRKEQFYGSWMREKACGVNSVFFQRIDGCSLVSSCHFNPKLN